MKSFMFCFLNELLPLKAKADPNICDADGISPLNLVIKNNNDDLVDKFIKARV